MTCCQISCLSWELGLSKQQICYHMFVFWPKPICTRFPSQRPVMPPFTQGTEKKQEEIRTYSKNIIACINTIKEHGCGKGMRDTKNHDKTYKRFWIKIALVNKLKNIVNMTARQTNLPSISCLHLQGFSAFRTVNHLNILWNVGDPKNDHVQHVPTLQVSITNTCGSQGLSNFDPDIPRPSKTPHWPHDAHISLTVLLWIISLVNFCKHGILRLRLSWDIPSKVKWQLCGMPRYYPLEQMWQNPVVYQNWSRAHFWANPSVVTPLHLDHLGRLLPSAANNQSRPPNPWIYFTQLHKSLDAQKWGSASMRIFAQWPKQSVIPLLLLGCHAQYANHQPLATRDLPIRAWIHCFRGRTQVSRMLASHIPWTIPPKNIPQNWWNFDFRSVHSPFSPRFPHFFHGTCGVSLCSPLASGGSCWKASRSVSVSMSWSRSGSWGADPLSLGWCSLN